ncbi:MAG: hypothetical protein C4530_22430 [Desulfobacteraceae bacterium]|nr:MAG: hypothetical protein C4530_22430 [Desulfobacteraceae bacterium]
MRKSTFFVLFITLTGISLAAMLFVYPLRSAARHQEVLVKKKMLVHALDLTDLCLFTEARYIRHLSQADLHSAFQDHPLALEHFPSGSIILPPKHLLNR